MKRAKEALRRTLLRGQGDERELASSSLEMEQAYGELERWAGPFDKPVILCGCPRTGTSLLAAALFQPPRVVSFMEPWDGLRLGPPRLWASLGEEAASGKIRRTRLSRSALLKRRKVEWVREGRRWRIEPSPKALVAVKWPCYWQLLGANPLARFLVTVRDPAETVESMRHRPGRLRQGLDHDVAFNRELHASLLKAYPDDETRRVGFFDAVYQRALQVRSSIEQGGSAHRIMFVHYERWFTEPERLWGEISEFLNAGLAPPRIDVVRGHASRAVDGRRWRAMSSTAEDLGYGGNGWDS